MQGLPECGMAKFMLILPRIPILILTTQEYPPPPPPPPPPKIGIWPEVGTLSFEKGCSWSVWSLIAVSPRDTVSFFI